MDFVNWFPTRRLKFSILIAFCLLPFLSEANEVHVYEQTLAGGVTKQLSDSVYSTGRNFSTQTAPTISGYVFTHWSISTTQEFSPQDVWGRALDSASVKIYEETTLTANYVPVSQDSDKDGVADGYELYWYGSLDYNGASDTDNDGVSFSSELTAGSNPIFPESKLEGPVAYVNGVLLQYNPYNYSPYTLMSNPEGVLVTTTNV